MSSTPQQIKYRGRLYKRAVVTVFKCRKCGQGRIADVNAKCSDRCTVMLNSRSQQAVLQHDGYVPADMGIGGGDYVRFEYCLDCGTIQGRFPLRATELEKTGKVTEE